MSGDVECLCRSGSPLCSLVDKVHFGEDEDEEEEEEEEICSSLVADYCWLNSFLTSEEVERSLHLYSSLMISAEDPQEEEDLSPVRTSVLVSLIGEVLSLDCPSVVLEELSKIFGVESVRSLLECYDSIVEERKRKKCPSVSEEDEKRRNEDLVGKKLVSSELDRLKLVQLEKSEGERLGLTICRLSREDGEDGISIGRILYGSVAQGVFSLGEEILEINEISLRTMKKNLDDLVHWIDSLHGPLSFLLRPSLSQSNPSFSTDLDVDVESVPVRCLFDYDPFSDIYFPCRDLGVVVRRGSILRLVDCSDENWYQAFVLGPNERECQLSSRPILVPSKTFQEKRFRIVKSFLAEEENNPKKKKSVSRQPILTSLNVLTYEPVRWYEVNASRKRPLVLIGAPYLGRHEFREGLMSSVELSSLIDVSIPHTSRERREEEVDGRDYHFISRKQFEEEIVNHSFVEFGEYEGNLYGTSKWSIEECCHRRNRVTILNLLPEGLDALKHCNLCPYVIFFEVPEKIEQLSGDFHFTCDQWKQIREISTNIENNYSHYFDRTFSLSDSFQSIFSQLKVLLLQVQQQSMWTNQAWFSPQERF